MNWDKIKKESPKAYNDWITYCQGKYGTAPAKDAQYILMSGSLFEFFDNNNIQVVTTIDNQFGYEIYVGFDSRESHCTNWFQERTECEQEAFIKAFEILEEK